MPKFSPGDTVLVSAIVASIDERKKTAKVSIGHGVSRSIITVPLRLVSKPLPKSLVEAASWANDLFGENNDDQKH